MKIAIRAGHTFSVPGASGILDETKENRKVKDAVIKYLKMTSHSILDVTPNDSYNTVSKEIGYGVNKANEWGADLFLSIHFNKAYSSYDGAIGSEVLVYDINKNNNEAKRVLNNIVSLGFKDRGVKERKDLGELRRTNMTSMIVEVCFIEAKKDVEIYRKNGYEKVALMIAEGIVGKIEEKPEVPDGGQEEPKPSKPETNWIIDLQKELNRSYGANLVVDGIAGTKTLATCPILKKGDKGEIVKILQKRLYAIDYPCGATGADGDFGDNTEVAIIRFQKEKKIMVDGIVGRETWEKLMEIKVVDNKENWVENLQVALNKEYRANLVVDGIAGTKTLAACPVLKKGDKGEVVKIVQRRLIELGFSCGGYGADGDFGEGTKGAVISYQKVKKISADGVIGQITWKKLLGL